MTDIRLVQHGTREFEAVTMDWLLKSTGELDTSEELATAARVALGTDRRANADDELPDFSDDRRGWWGDLDAGLLHDGWPIGSRLWLLSRAKITGPAARQGATVARAREYVREALQPFVDRAIASRIEVTAARTDVERIDATATIFRGPLAAIELRFQLLWSPAPTPAEQPAASDEYDYSQIQPLL